jgi:hypothetical protein
LNYILYKHGNIRLLRAASKALNSGYPTGYSRIAVLRKIDFDGHCNIRL